MRHIHKGCWNRAVFRQANFINRSIENIVHALRDAAIIVTVLLFLFLLNVRATIITLVAMPLSIAVGLLFLGWVGMTVNVMTLGGFAIAVGSLVDDAIIGMENVFRRLRQKPGGPAAKRRSRGDGIRNAIGEMRP